MAPSWSLHSRLSSLPSGLCAQLSLRAFARTALGGCEKAQERKGDATMVATEEQRTGK
jgi:hypothetical protein